MTEKITNFRERLSRTRKARNWNARRLAQEVNGMVPEPITSRDIIARTENGQRVTLPLSEALHYAEALGVKPEYLLFDGDDPSASSIFTEYYGLPNKAAKRKWSANGKSTGVRNMQKRNSSYRPMPVVQKDRDGEVIATFDGVRSAERWLKENGHPSAGHNNIALVCKGDRHSAYGYLWEYKDEA